MAFLDDDAVASPDVAVVVSTRCIRDEDILGVGGGIEADWERGGPALVSAGVRLDDRVLVRGPAADDAAQVRNLIGCNMSYRREGARGRRSLPAWATAVTKRTSASDWRPYGRDSRLLHLPDASVRHRVPGTREEH